MKKKYSIKGIDCANCAAKLEAKMNELPEVESVTLSFTTQQLYVEAENPDEAVKALQALADKVEPGTEIGSLKRGKRKAKAHSHEHHHHHDDDGDCCCGHDHDHEHHHHHHGHDADEIFENIGVETAKRFTEDGLRAALAKLSEEEDYGAILRAKGIVQAEDGRWLHFDYVPGETDIRYGSADYTGRLCVIGTHIDEKALRELFGV